MWIEQYFLMTDYSLWEVILNGDSPVPTRIVEGVLQPVAPTTAEQKLARKNELKAHESLDQIHDRLQKLVSQLEIHRADLEEQSLDDLFNNLKIYEAEVKHSSSTGTTTQNLAFVSSSNTDSTTESLSAAASVSAICAKMHVKGHFARECRSLKDSIGNEAVEPQRRTVPVESSTSNALVSQCDGVGSYDWSYQAKDEPANYAFMAFSSSSSSSDNEVPSCSKACSEAYAQLHSQYDKMTDDFCKSQFDVISYQTGLESVEARLLVYKQNEYVFEENIKFLNIEVQLRDNALVTLRQKLEKAKQERDDLELKLKKFQTSSKNLTELLAKSDCESWPPTPLYDRFQPSDGYHVVPPPYIRTFMPPKPGLVFNTAPTAVEIDHHTFTVQLSPTKPAQDLSHTNRPTTHIIEDWHVETTIPTTTPKPASLKFASSGKRRNRKACFVCKSVDHLIKDCDYHAKNMAQPTTRNHAHRVTHKHYAQMTPHNHQKHMVPAAVLTRSKPISIITVRPVSAVVPKSRVTQPRHAKPFVTKSKSSIIRHLTRSQSLKTNNSPPRVTAVPAPMGNPQHALKDKGVIDSGCSRHMTGNMSYLSDFEELNGGYVAFGGEDNVQQYVLFPVWSSGSNNPQNTDEDAAFEEKEPEFEGRKPEFEVNVSPSSSAQSKKHDDKTKKEAKGKSLVESSTRYRNLSAEFEDLSDNNINEAKRKSHVESFIGYRDLSVEFEDCSDNSINEVNATELEDIAYSDDEDDVGAEADFNNLETSITVSPISTSRIHKDHPVTQIIGDLSSTTQTRSMTRVVKDQGGLSQMFNDDFHTCMFACFLSQEEPKRVHQALKDPSWIEAMQGELLQFKMQKVWVLVDFPHGKRAIGTKWVFRNKKDKRGIVVRNKARLVAQGHTQEEGIDYE
nr:hypothetical protein [Tanacetum cinerariifolium]